MSNDELLNQIIKINNLIEKRNKNEATVEISDIVRRTCFDQIDVKNIQKIIKKEYKIKKRTRISGFYYNNLTLQVFIEEINNSLYLLQCIEERVQCESDSSYDSNEANSQSDDEVYVTKLLKQYYLTKSDVISLFHQLTKVNR